MITTKPQLEDLVLRIQNEGQVAIDTEFVWERTYYPNLGLVQFGFENGDSELLDPLAVEDPSPLKAVLEDSSILKIFHDAGQDLWILYLWTKAIGNHIFDTRLALGFITDRSSLSLKDALRYLLGIQLSKGQQRSNWLARPLSDKQLSYARSDVTSLVKLKDRILAKAEKMKRVDWIEEELSLCQKADQYMDLSEQAIFKRIKGRGKVEGRARRFLFLLAQWREMTAQTKNVNRQKVVGDDSLIRLAKMNIKSVDDIRPFSEVTRGFLKEHGVHVKLLSDKANDESIDNLIPQNNTKPGLAPELNACADLVQGYLKGKGLAEKIDPALFANRDEVLQIVSRRNDETINDIRLMNGWRYEFIGREVIQLLKGELSLKIDPQRGLPRIV